MKNFRLSKIEKTKKDLQLKRKPKGLKEKRRGRIAREGKIRKKRS